MFHFKVILLAILSTLMLSTGLRTHEVQPTIFDFTITENRLEIEAEWMIEAAVAKLDLSALNDTTDTENDGEYDRLRALSPADLDAAIREAWPAIAAKMNFRSGDTPLEITLGDVNVPDIGDLELSRLSDLSMTATLPGGDGAIVFSWDASLGALILRQEGVENGYSAFLPPGIESDPIPRP